MNILASRDEIRIFLSERAKALMRAKSNFEQRPN
jgi:hypothetical protein